TQFGGSNCYRFNGSTSRGGLCKLKGLHANDFAGLAPTGDDERAGVLADHEASADKDLGQGLIRREVAVRAFGAAGFHFVARNDQRRTRLTHIAIERAGEVAGGNVETFG